MKINLPAIIITSIAAYAIPKFFGAKKFVDQLKVELKSISIDTELIKKSGFKSLFWNVNLVIINPVNFSVVVDSIFMDIYFNNQLFAKANTIKKYKIEAKKKIIIPVLVGTEIASLPQSVFNAYTDASQNNNLDLLVKGKLNFKDASIKFNFTKSLNE